MENQSKPSARNFIRNEVLKIENRLFLGKLFSSTIGYVLTTFWLNSIRATAPIWLVWVLIIIQFALYFSIFIVSYQRSKVFRHNNVALILFVALAVLGRVNDLELLIIPLLVLSMLTLSTRAKKVSENGQRMLPED